jgi:hypothetical protein
MNSRESLWTCRNRQPFDAKAEIEANLESRKVF